MASKYLQKYPVPSNFSDTLHDFAREVLREQPDDIVNFAVDMVYVVLDPRIRSS